MNALPTTAEARAWLLANGWERDVIDDYDDDYDGECVARIYGTECWRGRQGHTANVPTDESETTFVASMACVLNDVAFAVGETPRAIRAAMRSPTQAITDLYVDTFDSETWADAWMQAISSKDPLACIQLMCAMSEICKDHAHTPWMRNWGANLAWYAADVHGRCVERLADVWFGVTRDDMCAILALSARCGGWWELTPGADGRVFVLGWVPPAPRLDEIEAR